MSNLFSLPEFRAKSSSEQGHSFIEALLSKETDELQGLGYEGRDAFIAGAVEATRAHGDESFHLFAVAAIRAMTAIRVRAESDAVLAETIYRAFDSMDEIFDLDYTLDIGMRPELGEQERLYEGAGLGVQTSYSSILCALEHLRLPAGGHLIDLGSGYGRIGLTAGLWRNDVRFTGYEFVQHRVDSSAAAADRAGVGDRVNFLCQDLADPTFEIPAADAYYMFDPFCESTYRRVLSRLTEIGRRQQVAVVAKAASRDWFKNLVSGDEWSIPESVDTGTIQIFRSRTVPG